VGKSSSEGGYPQSMIEATAGTGQGEQRKEDLAGNQGKYI
jgi:hypothetical protein